MIKSIELCTSKGWILLNRDQEKNPFGQLRVSYHTVRGLAPGTQSSVPCSHCSWQGPEPFRSPTSSAAVTRLWVQSRHRYLSWAILSPMAATMAPVIPTLVRLLCLWALGEGRACFSIPDLNPWRGRAWVEAENPSEGTEFLSSKKPFQDLPGDWLGCSFGLSSQHGLSWWPCRKRPQPAPDSLTLLPRRPALGPEETVIFCWLRRPNDKALLMEDASLFPSATLKYFV